MKRLIAAFVFVVAAVGLSISAASAARAAEPTGDIVFVSAGTWSDDVFTSSTYEGHIKGNATVTIAVTCEQGGVEVYSARSYPFAGASSPGVTFGVIFDLGAATADTTQSGDCVASLEHTVTKGQTVTVTVLDVEAFSVAPG